MIDVADTFLDLERLWLEHSDHGDTNADPRDTPRVRDHLWTIAQALHDDPSTWDDFADWLNQLDRSAARYMTGALMLELLAITATLEEGQSFWH